MRILILRQTAINGQAVRPGDVIDADPGDARTLVLMRKAAPAPDPDPLPEPAASVAPEPRKPRARKG